MFMLTFSQVSDKGENAGMQESAKKLREGKKNKHVRLLSSNPCVNNGAEITSKSDVQCEWKRRAVRCHGPRPPILVFSPAGCQTGYAGVLARPSTLGDPSSRVIVWPYRSGGCSSGLPVSRS